MLNLFKRKQCTECEELKERVLLLEAQIKCKQKCIDRLAKANSESLLEVQRLKLRILRS